MYQILGPKFIVFATAWAVISVLAVYGLFGLPIHVRGVVAIVDVLLLTILSSKPVWRFIWNKTGPLGRWLARKIYPDLNGTYDVTLESNWPIVKRMLDAAVGQAAPFDPFSRDQEAPSLLKVDLEATIEQTWFEIKMWIRPKAADAVIKQSKTLVTIPVEAMANHEKELVYVFEQENETRAPTDDAEHLGAARLRIDRLDSKILTGEYWNNRAWQRGVNAAGKITLRRISTS